VQEKQHLLTGFAGPDEQSCAGISPHDKRTIFCCQLSIVVGEVRSCPSAVGPKSSSFPSLNCASALFLISRMQVVW
jgi:hypothetical protein